MVPALRVWAVWSGLVGFGGKVVDVGKKIRRGEAGEVNGQDGQDA